LQLKDQMMLATGKMDVILARMLMHMYYLSGEVGKTLELFDVVASDGVTLSNVAYGLMNKGCETSYPQKASKNGETSYPQKA
jgi:hypothetical protein